jgi:hypothetical protein
MLTGEYIYNTAVYGRSRVYRFLLLLPELDQLY